jgi:hypothetical protein
VIGRHGSFSRFEKSVRLSEIHCVDACEELRRIATPITVFSQGSIGKSSVIALTVDANVDAHDYGAPRLRRIRFRRLATLWKSSTAGSLVDRALDSSVAVDESAAPLSDPRVKVEFVEREFR